MSQTNKEIFQRTLLTNNKPYYVYVLRSLKPINGKYTVKIGKTERPADLRKKEIESNNADPMKVVAVHHVSNQNAEALQIEDNIQSLFQQFKTRPDLPHHEWFRFNTIYFTNEVLSQIKNYVKIHCKVSALPKIPQVMAAPVILTDKEYAFLKLRQIKLQKKAKLELWELADLQTIERRLKASELADRAEGKIKLRIKQEKQLAYRRRRELEKRAFHFLCYTMQR